MAEACIDLGTVTEVTPSSDGCEDCLRIGAVHSPRAFAAFQEFAAP